MKIGIMTMHRIVNYGSFLQAFSLKKTLEYMGHQVVFVDYQPGPVLVESDDVEPQSKVVEFYYKVIWKLKNLIDKNQISQSDANQLKYGFREMYNKTLLPLLGVDAQPSYNVEVDMLVIGSDEVFNGIQTNPDVGFSKDLFGYNHKARRLISYAGSFGNTTVQQLEKYKVIDTVRKGFERFDSISVRDRNSEKIITNLLGEAPNRHIDPVFLFDYSEFMPKEKIDENYIVVYAYWGRITSEEAEAIKVFAELKKKKIICLCGPQKYLDNFMSPEPYQLLSYFRDADYIFTDTFHGSVFSIKYNKNFTVFVREGHGKHYGNSEKVTGLLDQFGLVGRVANSPDDARLILESAPDYKQVNEALEREIKKSRDYLQKEISLISK